MHKVVKAISYLDRVGLKYLAEGIREMLRDKSRLETQLKNERTNTTELVDELRVRNEERYTEC